MSDKKEKKLDDRKDEEKIDKEKDKNIKKDKKYPRVIASVFIFNEKDEILLIKQPKWKNKYSIVGGKVEIGESIEGAVKREALEESGLNVTDIKLIKIIDGLGLRDHYKKDDNHLIFLSHKALAKEHKKVKLNEESTSYKWQTLDAWLKLGEDKFAPTIYELLLRMKNEPVESKEDLSGLYKRALADYQNLLRQTAKDKEDFYKYASEALLYDIIPVYDNLKISMEHVDETAAQSGWAQGIKYVIKQFNDALENNGVKEIKTVGKKFDHHTMEAVEGKGEKVIKEVKPGYRLRDKVIIHAKVILEGGEKKDRGKDKNKDDLAGRQVAGS